VIRIRVCTTIDAPPVDVWRAVEHIERHPDWMRDAVSVTFRSEARSGVGAEFDCLTRVGPVVNHDRVVVTRWEPGRVMGIEHRGAVTGDAEFRLEPRYPDRTRFCWEERLRFPWWLGGIAGERVGGQVLRRIWSGNVARLKDQVEAASGG
jgi:uncharacterized protein YndB with AHSA1/START domain